MKEIFLYFPVLVVFVTLDAVCTYRYVFLLDEAAEQRLPFFQLGKLSLGCVLGLIVICCCSIDLYNEL